MASRDESSTSSTGDDDETERSDLEVATVLSKGINTANGQIMSPSKGYAGSLGKYDYSPFRPTTVMTNISRGNIKTETPVPESISLHQMAAQGELILLQEEIKGQDANHLNHLDDNGLSPLMWAAANNQLLTVDCLLEHGAEVNLSGPQDSNALLMASAQGHDRLVARLLQAGMDINHVCLKGNSALLYATHGNHTDCVKVLLEWGADMTQPNLQNHTPMDLAVTLGHKEVQRIIEQYLLKLLDPEEVGLPPPPPPPPPQL